MEYEKTKPNGIYITRIVIHILHENNDNFDGVDDPNQWGGDGATTHFLNIMAIVKSVGTRVDVNVQEQLILKLYYVKMFNLSPSTIE